MYLLVIGIILFTYILQTTLSYLNARQKGLEIPENVKDIYDEKRYKEWLAYSKANTRFGLISRTISVSVLLILLSFDAALLQLMADVAFLTDNGWLQTLIFLGIYQGLSFLISSILSYYQTFKIEEDFGFNKTTKKTFISDKIKQLLLTIILGGGLVTGLYFLFDGFKDELLLFVVSLWVSIMVILALISYLNTAVFVKIFNKIEPLEDGELKSKIEALADKIGFKVKAISKMDASRRSTKLNAFFSGFGKQKEIVLFDTLLEKMTDEEILSVLAHEFAHGKHKDVQRMFIEQALQIALFSALVFLVLTTESLYTAFGFDSIFFGFGLILFTILTSPLDLVLSPITMALSRKAEYKADAYSVSLLGKESMISALKRLAKESLSDLNPHPFVVFMYYSHPPMSLRIAAIDSL
jgi:STE24 endopeptidase